MGLLTLSVVAAQSPGPPGEPSDVKVTRATDSATSLVVTWEAPALTNRATITGYTVRWRKSSVAHYDSADVNAGTDPTAVTYTITGVTGRTLEAGVEYTVQVRADATVPDGDDADTEADVVMGAWATRTGTPAAAPAAPADVSVTRGSDATSLVVSWEAPELNGATITGYTVQWRVTTDTVYDSANMASVSGLTYTITGLTSGTAYTVQVRADATVPDDDADADADADEVMSVWADGAGTPAAAPAVPSDVSVDRGADGTSLVVSWAAPDELNGATITGYTVRWRKSSVSSYHSGDVNAGTDPAAVTYTITGLTSGTAYTVQVRADATVPDDGADEDTDADVVMSMWVTQTGTPGTSAPGAPADVKVTRGTDATSLVVNWAAPMTNGATITGYTVRWRKSSVGHYDSADVNAGTDPEAVTYTITGLTTDTAYTVQVRADATVPDGDDADTDADVVMGAWATQTGTPGASAPGEPADVKVVRGDNATSLVVSWAAPDELNGATITGYTVRWRKSSVAHYDSADVNAGTDPTAVTYTITPTARPLEAGVEYTVQVRADATVPDGDDADTDADVVMGDWATQTGTPAAAPAAPAVSTESGYAQLVVSWEAPELNGATITGYTVQWRESSVTTYDSADQADVTGAMSYTITGLTNDTEYTVQVRAEATLPDDDADADADADEVMSEWSSDATGTPAAASAAAPGTPVVSIEAGHEQLVVSWQAPADNRAAITSYTVQWKSGGEAYEALDAENPSRTHTTADGMATSYTIENLTNGMAYMVQVRATNAVDDGPWSDEQSGTPASVPDKPENVMVTAGNSQLMVSWQAPAANHADGITGYTVQWKMAGQDDYVQANAAADATSHTIPNLTNGMAYMVQVRATNAEGAGPWSDEQSGTPASVPGMPMVYIAAGDGQLVVSWTVPAANHADGITGYTVQWKSGDQGYGSDRQADAAADATSHTIMDLTNDMAYMVQVRATNAEGAGPWSDEQSGTPAASPPVETVTRTETRTVYRDRPAPAPAPVTEPTIIGDSGYATTYLAVDGQSIELRIHPQAGGPASHTFAIGSFIRDADLGQTYQIVAGGKRRWIAPTSPLVYQVPWAQVNSMYTFASNVVAAIPLDESNPPQGFLVRGMNGRIVSYDAGMWRHIPNIPTFQALGYRWCDVNNADAGFFGRISEGSAHPPTSQPENPNYPVCG